MSLRNFRAQDFKKSGQASTKRPAKKRVAAPSTPAVDPNVVPDGTSDEILAWVGEDKDRATRALDKELSSEQARVTLTGPLEKILEPSKPEEPIKKAAAKKAPAKKAAAKKTEGDSK